MQYLIDKARKSNLEVLNTSFNKHQINSPKKSFYLQKYTQEFELKDLSDLKTYSDFYKSFSDFLTVSLKRDGLFVLDEKNVFEYLKNKANNWVIIDDEVDKSQGLYTERIEKVIDTRTVYLVKKFIIDGVNGLITETIFKRKMENFYGIQMEKTSPEDDAEICVDFFGNLKNIKVGFQVKPKTFFFGIKYKKQYCLNSLYKIKNAATKYKNIIFLVFIENNNIFFAMRDKNKEECVIINEEKFFKLLDINLNDKILLKLTNETFDKIQKKLII